jgi:signal transduction histidine kinase
MRRSSRNTVIEPFKQIRIGAYVIGISLLFIIAMIALVSFSFIQQYRHVMEIFEIVDPTAQWALITNDIFYNNAMYLGALIIAYVLVLFVVVFKTTHNVYGPLVSIERFVEQIKTGEYQKRLAIRKKDDLQDLSHALNSMASELEKRHGIKDRRSS